MIARIGRATLSITTQAGAIGLLLLSLLAGLFPYPRFDRRELLRHLHKMGVRSLPIIALTALFTGGIMVVQSSIFVTRFGAEGLLGWATGYSIFREIGPVLIALMFSGRVGSNNTAELATMIATEQIDALRALAIDPVQYLLLPRVLAMVTTLFLLTVFGNAVAIAGGALAGELIVGVSRSVFWHSLQINLGPWDLLFGLIKSAAFGLIVAVISCTFGLHARGGAVGVGQAVKASVVASAVGILVLDILLTLSLT